MKSKAKGMISLPSLCSICGNPFERFLQLIVIRSKRTRNSQNGRDLRTFIDFTNEWIIGGYNQMLLIAIHSSPFAPTRVFLLSSALGYILSTPLLQSSIFRLMGYAHFIAQIIIPLQ